jgi:hypothetical protein
MDSRPVFTEVLDSGHFGVRIAGETLRGEDLDRWRARAAMWSGSTVPFRRQPTIRRWLIFGYPLEWLHFLGCLGVVAVPCWLGVFVLREAYRAAMAWSPEARRARALRAGVCPSCGYNIHHLPTRRCPECGETWSEDEVPEDVRSDETDNEP